MKDQNADVILKYLDYQITKLVERTDKEKKKIEQLNEDIIELLQNTDTEETRVSLL